ncbi:MAG: hypothetical protein EZS28_036270, partial [Streblomastix strix]
GNGEGQIDEQEVILRRTGGETISIADWRKFWKELDTDLKLDAVRLQSPVSDLEEQGKEKDQKMISDRKVGDKEEEDEITEEVVPEEIEAVITEIIEQLTHIIIVITTICLISLYGHQLNQFRRFHRIKLFQNIFKDKLVVQIPNLRVLLTHGNQIKLLLPNNNQNNLLFLKVLQPSISTSQSSETTSSNIIPIPIPSMHQIQQEQHHLLHTPVATSPPPINPSKIDLSPVVDTRPNDIIQPMNNMLAPQLPDPTNSWSNITTQPIEQGQKRISDTYVTKSTEQSSEIFNGWNAYEFGSQKQRFLLKISKSTLMTLINIEYKETRITIATMMHLEKLIQYSQKVRGHRGKGKKGRGRGKAQFQAQSLLTNHQPIKESTQSQLKVPEQRRERTGTANGTINPSAYSSRIKQITGWSDFNFGSTLLLQQPHLNWRQHRDMQGEKLQVFFAAQCANVQHLNDGNEINIPQHSRLAAQRADGLGFQPLICPEQEQSEVEPEQDLSQLDLNNLPDNPENECLPGLIQETRRSEANKGSIQPRPKSSRKKKKGR